MVRGHAAAAHHVEDIAILRIGTGTDRTRAGGVPEVRVRQPEGVADFVGDNADRIAIHPHAAAAAPAARGPRTAVQTQHDAVKVIRVEADLPRFIAGMSLLQAEAVDVATVGGVFLHVPGFVARKLDWRRDGGECREAAIR